MIRYLAIPTCLTIIVSLIFASCSDPVEAVQLNFKMTYEDAPLVMFEDVAYADGRNMKFSRISFFISDLALTGNGVQQGGTNVEYLILSDAHLSLEDAQNGMPLNIAVDADNYDNLQFNIGLTADQNATVPSDYTSDSPLSKTGEYWPGWTSYVFAKFEGDIDLDNNGTYDAGETFSLHIGTEAAMRALSLNLSESKENYDVTIDIARVFNNNGAVYDIDGMRQIHSLNDQVISNITQLSDNLSSAISL